MNIGASSACFYPLETEKALLRVGEAGFGVSEIFFNTFSELSPDFLRELCKIRDAYSLNIAAVHPFSSGAEQFFIFGNYERRFRDTVELYKRYFEAAAALGASIFVLHGAFAEKTTPDEQCYERFGILSRAAKSFGVTVAQENVVRFASQSPAYIAGMRSYLGNDFAMVLDIKQTCRAGHAATEYIAAAGERIVHVHLSDNDAESDCLPPGKGSFDFSALFAALSTAGYNGKGIIELYSHSFTSDSELVAAKKYLENTLS